MNTLRQSIAEYLALRRSLGFKMNEAARTLPDFATFMERRRAAYITQALALRRAQMPQHAQPAHWASRPRQRATRPARAAASVTS